MGILGEESKFAESIIRFIFKNEDPPGPVPPDPPHPPDPPIPPDPPGPGPTPTPGGGGGTEWWNAALTGDTLMWIMLAIVAVAMIAFGVLLYKRYKRDGAMVRTAENPGIGSVVSSLISQNSMLKVFAIVISCLVAIFACTSVANAGIKAVADENTAISALAQVEAVYPSDVLVQADTASQLAFADDPEPQPEPKAGISLDSGPYIDITVYKDGSLGIPDVVDKVKNIDTSDGYFYSLEVSSDKQELNDAIWKFTSGNTVLFNQVANKANETNFSLPIAISETLNIGLTVSNLLPAKALSLVAEAGDKPVEVAKVKYMADGNVMAGPTAESIVGVFEEEFNKDGHDPTFASSVIFCRGNSEEFPTEGSEPGQYRSKVDVSRACSGSIMAYMVNDEGGGYHIEVWSEDEIICAPNTCSRMFQNFRGLNEIDFNNLNTSSCTDFSYMFENCGRDDGEASMLDFSKPFKGTGKFTTGENASFASMFYGADCSLDLTNLDTSKVVKMDNMFAGYADNILDSARSKIVLKLGEEDNLFKIPKDCTVDYMFAGCNYDITNGPDGPGESAHNLLSELDTSESEHFARMFAAYAYVPPVVEPEPKPGNEDEEPTSILDVSLLDVSHAKDMSQMFMFTYAWKTISDPSLTIKFGKDSSDFYPGSANDKAEVNMYGFFETTNIINLDLSPINFSKVTSMDSMFAHYGFLNINSKQAGLIYREVTITWPKSTTEAPYPAAGCDADYMYCATSIAPNVLDNWDGTKVDSAKGMFLEYGWNTNYALIKDDAKVVFPEGYKFADNCVCEYMFHQAKCAVDLSGWDASNIWDFKGMFLSYGSLNRQGTYEITWAKEGKMFTPKEGASFEGMFEMVQIQRLDLSQLDINKASNLSYMFEGYGQTIALSKEILQPFAGVIRWPSYEDASGNPLPIKPAKPTAAGQEGANMSYMFLNYRMCGEEKKNLLDLSNWDTSNVRNFQGMFSGFNGYKLLGGGFYGINVKFPENGLKTGAQANISYMFENSMVVHEAKEIPKDKQKNFMNESVGIRLVNVIDTSKVVNFSHLFDGAYSMNTSTGENGSGPFWYEHAYIDVASGDYSKAEDMSYMFANAFCKMTYGPLGGAPVLNGQLKLFNSNGEDDPAPTVNGEHFFDGCNAEILDMRTIDTSVFNNVSYFFANYGYIDCHGKIYNLNSFSIKNKTSVAGLFYNAYFDTEEGADLVLDWTEVDVSGITDMSYMFFNFKPKVLDISTWNPSSCVNMEGMFMSFGVDALDNGKKSPEDQYNTTLKLPTGVEDNKWTTGSECNMKWMFAMCCCDVNLKGFDVSKVTNMEGMFMGYGTSSQELIQAAKNLVNNLVRMIRQILSKYIPMKAISDEEITQMLLNGNFDTLIDAVTAETLANNKSIINDSFSSIDSLTSNYKGMAQLTSSLTQTANLPNDIFNGGFDQAAFDQEVSNSISSDLTANTLLDSQTYKNMLSNYLDSSSKTYTDSIKYMIKDVLADSGFEQFFELAKQASGDESASEAVPNAANKPFKLTLPDPIEDPVSKKKVPAFKPASDASYLGAKRCSMKAMFAFFNFANTEFKESTDKVSNYAVDLSRIDTEYVCDMSYMFTAYLFYPAADIKGEDKFKLPKIDVSGFSTSNIGPYDPSSLDEKQPVGSMKMMFAATGSMANVDTSENPKVEYNTEFKFGEKFVISEKCDTRLMFLYTRASKVDMTKVNVTNAGSFAGMFALCNIRNLDLSTWGSANSLVAAQYMFAGYGLLGFFIDNSGYGFNISLGNSEKKFKLYTQKGLIAVDTNVEGMFAFPLLSKLDLTNVDVSERRSLSRMFEFCIMPAAVGDSAREKGPILDISSWNTSKVNDFSYMFAFSFLHGINLPAITTPDTGAICDYMFLFAHTNEMQDSVINGLDFTESDFSNVTSAKGMFMCYNIVFPAVMLSKATLNLGANTFSKLTDASWMFAFTSTNLDLSGITMSNISNADYMFAFFGIAPYSRYEGIRAFSAEKALAYYASIEFPTFKDKALFSFAEGATTNYMFLLTLAGDPAKFKEGLTHTPQSINLDFMDTQNVASMKGMFMLSCPSFDLTKLNTTKVKSTMLMFAGYGLIPVFNLAAGDSDLGLDYLPSLDFPVSAIEGSFKLIGDVDTRFMFSSFVEWPGIDDKSKELKNFDLSGIDVSKLTNFKLMFALGLGICNFDLSNWDISKAKNLDMMFLAYGLFSRLDAEDSLFFECPASGRMLKLPTKLPAAPTTSSEGYCSASWMFAFASILDCDGTKVGSGDIINTTLDLSGWDFSGIQKADHMFFAYNFALDAYEKALDNISDVLGNILWQYNVYFRDNETIFSSPHSVNTNLMKLGAGEEEEVDQLRLVEIKFSQSDATKFANEADLTAAFAFADCNVNAPKLDLTNVKSCDSMFAFYAPSWAEKYEVEEKEKKPEPEPVNKEIIDEYAFKLTLPTNLKFATGASVKQMFMFYFPHSLAVAAYDVSGVADMTRMFAFCRASEINTGNWNTSSCVTMEGMFLGASAKVIDMTNWKYTKVKNMRFMFMAYSNRDVSTMVYFPENGSMRAADGCDCTGMFALCDARSLMLHGFNLEGISSIDYMFTGCVNLERIHVSVNTDWTVYGLAGSYMFYGCQKLKGQSDTKFMTYHTNIEFARVDNPTKNAPGYFTGIWTLAEPTPAENNNDIQSIFIERGLKATDLANVKTVEFKRETPPTTGGADISNTKDRKIVATISEGAMTISCEAMVYSRATSCIHLFRDFKSLQTIKFNNNLDTIAATSMQGMFDGCAAAADLDLSSLRTGNVEDFSYMFENFGAPKTKLNFLADSQLFDTNSARTFKGMFQGCKVAYINIRNFVYYNADDLSYMFKGSGVSDINFYDEGSYKHENVHISADFTSMFEGCNYLTSLKLGGFVPDSGSTLKATFKGCTNLKKIYQKLGFNYPWQSDGSQDTFSGCTSLKNEHNEGIGEFESCSADLAHAFTEGQGNGLFSSCSWIADPKDGSSIGLIQERFDESKVDSDGAEKFIFCTADKPDREYVIDEVDLSQEKDNTIIGYKVSYLPSKQWENGDPYYIVVNSDWYVWVGPYSFRYLLKGFKNLETVEFGNDYWQQNGVDLTGMFNGCSNLTRIDSSHVNEDGSAYLFNDPVSMREMFLGCSSLESFSMNLFNLPAKEGDVTTYPNFEFMFSECESLQIITSDKGLNFESLYPGTGGPTSNFMFKNCKKLMADGYYNYEQCCIDLGVKPEDGPNYKAAKAHIKTSDTDNNHGLFSAGAVLPNPSGANWGIIRDAMERAFTDKTITSAMVYERTESVEFFKSLDNTAYYTNKIVPYMITNEPISLNGASQAEGPIYMYIYATDSSYSKDKPIKEYTGCFGVIISTPSNNNQIMYASASSFKRLCQGMDGLKYFSFEPGENLHCKTEDGFETIDVSEMIDTTRATDCSYMFSGTCDYHNILGTEALTEGIYLNNFDTSHVWNFESMFENCKSKLINLNNGLTPNEDNILLNSMSNIFKVENDTQSKFSFENATNMKSMFERAGYSDAELSVKELSFSIQMPSVVIFPNVDEGTTTTINKACDASDMFRYSHFRRVEMENMKFSGVTNFSNMCSFNIAFSFQLRVPSKSEFDIVSNLIEASRSNDDARIEEAFKALNQNQIVLDSFTSSSNWEQYFGTDFIFNEKEDWGPTIAGHRITMDNMFAFSMVRNLNLSHLNTKKVHSMKSMFSFMPLIDSVRVGDEKFDTSNVESMNRMFAYFGSITGQSTFGFYDSTLSKVVFPAFKIKEGCVLAEMFANANLPVDLSGWVRADAKEGNGLNCCKDYSDMFYQFAYYVLPPISIEGATIGYPENMTISLPSSNWIPPTGSYMTEMFRGCKSNVDLSGITSFEGVIDMSRMFMSYGNGDVTWMGYKQVGITLGKGDATKAWMIKPGTNTSMAGMFEGYKGLDVVDALGDTRASFQDIVNALDTTNVVEMSEMFCGAKVSKIDFTKATKFDTSKVRNMYYMFGSKLLRDSYIEILTFDDQFKIDNVVDMRYMFGSIGDYQAALHTINYEGKNGDWASIIDAKLAKNKGSVFTEGMFYACVNIIGGLGTKAKTSYNVDKVDHSLARPAGIDEETGEVIHGYFTVPEPENAYTKDDAPPENKTSADSTLKNSPEIVDDHEAIGDVDLDTSDVLEDEVIELESPFDKLEVLLEDSSEVKAVALTFFQSIFNSLTKILLNIN